MIIAWTMSLLGFCLLTPLAAVMFVVGWKVAKRGGGKWAQGPVPLGPGEGPAGRAAAVGLAVAFSAAGDSAAAAGSVAEAPAAAEPAVVGKRKDNVMTPEELVGQLEKAIPGRLCSAVLYGSAAAGDFVPGTSNYNVLLVLDRLGGAELDAISKPALQWAKAGNRPPLLFTRSELQASADALSHRTARHPAIASRAVRGRSAGRRGHPTRALVPATGAGIERQVAGVAGTIPAHRRQAEAGGRVAGLFGCRLSGFVSRGLAVVSGRRACAQGRCAAAACRNTFPLIRSRCWRSRP